MRGGDVGGGLDLVAGRIEDDGVDDSEVVDAAVFESEGEIAAFAVADMRADGAAELEAVALLADGGLRGGERVLGVLEGAAVGGKERSVEDLLARLGVDLDTASFKGRLAVLGGELVGVDLDVGDGGFGRQIARALEAVDGDGGVGGAAAGEGGELLELAEEVVGVVGELLELFAGEGLGRTGGGAGGRCVGFGAYVNVGLDGLGLEREVERGGAGFGELYGECSEAGCSDGELVRAVRNAEEAELAVGATVGGLAGGLGGV